MTILEQDIRLPLRDDFEVFRKTDPAWQKCIEWFNDDNKDDDDSETETGIRTMKVSRLERRERFLVREWPRDPNGPKIQEIPRGKDTGNGCELWGATLYDFYMVNRLPSFKCYSTITSGSKLAAWAKEHGELEWAKEQLHQAELEDDPRVIPPYDISTFIEYIEEQIFKGRTGRPLKGKQRAETYPEASDYSRPWPIKPFSTPTIRLQKQLPRNTLPRVLIVHDPWNVLEVLSRYNEYEDENLKWGSRPDIIRVYERKSLLGGDDKPNYEDDHCPEAHLYITPKRRIGTGHHSFVYQVELVLPRTVLVEPKICEKCSISGEGEARSSEIINFSCASGREQLLKLGDEYLKKVPQSVFPADGESCIQLGPTHCEHLDRGFRPPSMARVSVCAKISLPNNRFDENHEAQLRSEARNYESFPSHMFEHWNGYNILPPLQDPTPVGAVVPQFYGYYVPVREKNDPCMEGRYMSAILLLEHCGFAINAQKLPLADRQECFSLMRRMHLAGYEHNSIYERNFLMQYGPLSALPWERSSLHPRFRLIDFGRSVKLGDKCFMAVTDECANAQENLNCGLY